MNTGRTEMGYGSMDAQCAQLAPKEQPEVQRAIDDLSTVIERYNCLVSRLPDKLNSVMFPSPPTPDCAKVKEYRTPLAQCINDMACRMTNITNELELMYERIAL